MTEIIPVPRNSHKLSVGGVALQHIFHTDGELDGDRPAVGGHGKAIDRLGNGAESGGLRLRGGFGGRRGGLFCGASAEHKYKEKQG